MTDSISTILFRSALIAVLLLCTVGIVAADDYIGGIPLTTVKTGTVTGDLWFDAAPAPNWGSNVVTKTFTLPAAAVGSNVKWARLYVSAYCGHMQNDYAFTITNKWDGNGDGSYETTWPETGHAPFHFLVPQNDGIAGNDNRALGGGSSDPFKMLNDHETRVTSDYFMWYDVTTMIKGPKVNVNVDTTGSFDGRIKVITLVVAYDDPASTTQTAYWVNQGHDSCSYYTEGNFGTAAVGTTTFGTAGLSGITSAKLTIDYMASNNGNYGFPTAENDFTYTGGTPPVTGTFSNAALDRIPDVQGAYSGVDSWDATAAVNSGKDVTFAYARYFPATGTAAFYKLPLAFLVVKKAGSAQTTSPTPTPTGGSTAGLAADFVANATAGPAPLAVQFTDSSTGEVTAWAWDLNNDGTIDSTKQNPSAVYADDGIFTVNLTVTGPNGTDSEVKPGYITVGNATPTPTTTTTTPTTTIVPTTTTTTAPTNGTSGGAGFTAEPVLSPKGNAVKFTVTPAAGKTVQAAWWSFDAPDHLETWNSRNINPTFFYPRAGCFSPLVRLTYTDGTTEEVHRVGYITAAGTALSVPTAAAANFTAVPYAESMGNSARFTLTQTAGKTIQEVWWSFDAPDHLQDWNSWEINPAFFYPQKGTFSPYVKITYTDGTVEEVHRVGYITVA